MELADFYEEMEKISNEIDLIALKLSSLGQKREDRDILLTNIHRIHPLAYAFWVKSNLPREKKYKIRDDFENDSDYQRWYHSYKQSQKISENVSGYLLPEIRKGIQNCKKMFSLVLDGEFTDEKFTPYYFSIACDYYLLAALSFEKKHKEQGSLYSQLKHYYRVEKTRAAIINVIERFCSEHWNICINWEEKDKVLINKGKELAEELDQLIEKMQPGYSKSISALPVTDDPFDEQLKDLGTPEGFQRALKEGRVSRLYFKVCENCSDIFPHDDFSKPKRRGPKRIYCDDCQLLLEKENNKERVRKYRSKKQDV